MGVIFVVSPVYLEAVLTESKKYSFDLQGYGTFRRAVKGLVTLNAADCLGFAFVGESLPKKGSSEYKEMLDFYNRCNMMGASKKVVLIANSMPQGCLKVFRQFSNLRFVAAGSFDFMTDTLINKNLFGSILLDNYEPYALKKHAPERKREFVCDTLKYSPVVNAATTDCIRPFEKLETLQLTLENDPVYQGYRRTGSSMLAMRKYFITKSFTDDCTSELSAAQQSVEMLRGDVPAWCLAMCMLKMIKEHGRAEGVT